MSQVNQSALGLDVGTSRIVIADPPAAISATNLN